jgi:hypothetical protein
MFSKRLHITTIFINIFQNNFRSLVKLPVNMPFSPHSRPPFQLPRLLPFPTPALSSAPLQSSQSLFPPHPSPVVDPNPRPWSGFAPPRDWLATSKSSVFSSSSPRGHPATAAGKVRWPPVKPSVSVSPLPVYPRGYDSRF